MRRDLLVAGPGFVLGLCLAACTAGPSGTPTVAPTPVVVRVAATDMGESLARDLAEAYREVRPDVTILIVPATEPDAQVLIAAEIEPAGSGFRSPLGGVKLVPAMAAEAAPPTLSAAQLAAVLSGEVEDWAQVGGSPGPITVVTRESESEAERLITQRFGLGVAPPTARVAPGWAASRALISGTAGAIGVLPSPETDATLRVLSTSLSIMIGLEARAANEPTGVVRDWLAWAQSPAGQFVVAERHIPLAAP